MHCFDLKVNVWCPFVGMALLGLILTACSDSTDNPGDPGEEIPIGDDASDKMSFKVTQTVVNNGESTQTVALRYSDFSAFYAPSVGEQIANWYANK